MIQAVIFDMDGILIDSEPLWKEAQIVAFRRIGITMTIDMCNLTMGYRTNEVVEFWFKQLKWENRSKAELENDIHVLVTNLIIEKGKEMSGVTATLKWLKEKNMKTALASSSSMAIISTVIDKLKIRNYFDVIQSAEIEEYGKPHPAVFLKAAKNLGVDPMDCLVIEDSGNGVIAAKAARMKVIAIPDHSLKHDKRFLICESILDDMRDFDALLLKSLE